MCEVKISPVISTNKKRHSHQQFLVSKCEYYAKSLQSCPTQCDPIDSSPPGSAVPGITGVGCHFLLQCMKVKSESEDRKSVV